MARMQKITTFLWFDDEAEEAARFYTSIFKRSRIVSVTRYNEAGPGKPGSVMAVTFEFEGQQYIALNGGPIYEFNEAISLQVLCENQREVDRLWEKLSAGGEKVACGWLKDKYGLSWQITPKVLYELFDDEDPEKVRRVNEAMLKMKKLDIAKLKAAARKR